MYMTEKDHIELILQGIRQGDQIGGPFALAKIFAKSLKKKNKFDEVDVRSKYLKWWKGDAFDTGPTFASVFTKISKRIEPKLAVKQVHEDFGFNTAGCGPAQRATPLAGMLSIPSEKLTALARKEAKITHYDDDAGNGSAIVILLCRYLLEGNNFKNAQKLISDNHELRDSWQKIKEANLKSDGYVFNVIYSALYFIDNNKSLADILKFAGKANYSPVIYSVINICMQR